MNGWYVPEHVNQLDGTMCAPANCWAAVGAWLASAATAGVVDVSPSDFRKAAGGGSGSKGPSGCRSGFESDIVQGLDKLGIPSIIVKVDRPDAREILERDRRAVWGVAVDYEIFDAAQRCQDDFEGNHMLGIIGGKPTSSMDPLCADYKDLGLVKLLDAAEKFSKDHARGGTIFLVKVRRPIPANTGDKLKIAELTARIDDLEDALREVTAHTVKTLDVVRDVQ